ncbi:hypothetical protein BH11MYX2_BH11MYX2_07340 [soil metagenome]
MNDMAALAPSSSDARIPCPACGTLIHPVAGRCKHCKQDLAQFRASRPAANAALPALAPRATPVAGTPAVVAAEPSAPAAVIVPDHVAPAGINAPRIASPFPNGDVERAYDPNRPVLPPRVTPGHGVVKKESWIARNWPIVVSVLASAAIIGAVVLMMLPPAQAGAGKKNGAGAPAPERMDTDQLPEKKPDPWGGASPTPPSRTAPDPVPAQPDPNALPDLNDPFAQTAPTPDPNDPLSNQPFDPSARGGNNVGAAIMFGMLGKICDKANTCGTTDPTTARACAGIANMPHIAMPQNCPAATECMNTIEKIDVCGAMANNLDPYQLIQSTASCIKAMSSC